MNMKSHLLAAALLVTGLAPLHAQSPSPEPSDNPPGDERLRKKDMRDGPGFLAKLPPEARERFKAAREKALQDPKIQELRKASDKANREFFEAMRQKMQEIDPELAEIVKKSMDADKKGPEGRGGGQGKNKGLQSLTEEEREKLMSAREKAKDDPAVKAARDQREEATTPEERQKAGEAYHEAMNTALLKADPSLAPVLKKLENTPPPPPPPHGDEMAPPPSPATP